MYKLEEIIDIIVMAEHVHVVDEYGIPINNHTLYYSFH